jgi:hypothetical protein
MNLPHALKTDLRKTVGYMYGKEWFHPYASGEGRLADEWRV